MLPSFAGRLELGLLVAALALLRRSSSTAVVSGRNRIGFGGAIADS